MSDARSEIEAQHTISILRAQDSQRDVDEHVKSSVELQQHEQSPSPPLPKQQRHIEIKLSVPNQADGCVRLVKAEFKIYYFRTAVTRPDCMVEINWKGANILHWPLKSFRNAFSRSIFYTSKA